MILVEKCYDYDGCEHVALVETEEDLVAFKDETHRLLGQIAEIKKKHNLAKHKDGTPKWAHAYQEMTNEISAFLLDVGEPFSLWLFNITSVDELSFSDIKVYSPKVAMDRAN